MNKLAFVLLLTIGSLAGFGAAAQPVRVEAVEVELVADRSAAVPGQTTLLGLRISHDRHWHTYWRNPGDSGLPTQVKLAVPEGWQAGPMRWPVPQRVFVGPLASYAYEGEIVLPIPVSVPASAAGDPVKFTARVQWLMCREVCIPGEADLALALPIAASAQPSAHAPLFEQAARSMPAAELAVRASLADGRVSLGFDRPAARTAEFFPYAEGWIDASAPQPLFRLGGDGTTQWRLELKLAAGVDRAALAKAGFDGAVIGVMRVDGELLDLRAAIGDAPIAGGTLVATALGSPAFPAGSFGGGGSKFLSSPFGGGGASPLAGTAPGGLSLVVAALFGVLGGLILNLMPCVFPVIGLKVLGFARHAQSHHGQARRSALVFAAGVLVSFWILAALTLVLRAAGEAAGWGFQLQAPAFVALMALLFVVIAMNFAGVFEFGARLTQLGGAERAASDGGTMTGTFGSGMLAVLVATPCTAPFMGSALGYTLGRPAPEVLLVFSALALGMSLPYLLLGFYPRALAWLPRPGRWMESFKQFLAFPMFATAAWLAWVLGLQAGIDAVLGLAIGAVLVALAAWLYGRFVQSGVAVHRLLAGTIAVVSLSAGIWLGIPGASASSGSVSGDNAGASASTQLPDGWEAWSEAKVADALAARRPVFVDFTAAWCVSCQANKLLVLNRDPVVTGMVERKVLKLRADWTHGDPAITAELARHGRNGVPLYLLYVPGEAAPRVLPEILTSAQVMDALRAIR